MTRLLIGLFLAALLAMPVDAGIPGLGLIKCLGCERDKHGKIKRSRRAVNAFRKANQAPRHCKLVPGCKIDHIVPLACSKSPAEQKLLDDKSNMQWQSKVAADMKDKWERNLCYLEAPARLALAAEHKQKLPPHLLHVGIHPKDEK